MSSAIHSEINNHINVKVVYTVGHKNVPLYMLDQNLMDFNILCTNKNRKKYSIGELQNLQHYHNCVSTLPRKI